MTESERSPGAPTEAVPARLTADGAPAQEHFRPIGTVFILVMFVAALILLWLSVYVILLSRGATS